MKQIQGLGFPHVTACVAHVAAEFTIIAADEDGRLVLVAERSTAYLHLILEWNEEQSDVGFWSIVTLIPKRHKRDIVAKWTKARPDESEPASGSASTPRRFETLSLPKKLTGNES